MSSRAAWGSLSFVVALSRSLVDLFMAAGLMRRKRRRPQRGPSRRGLVLAVPAREGEGEERERASHPLGNHRACDKYRGGTTSRGKCIVPSRVWSGAGGVSGGALAEGTDSGFHRRLPHSVTATCVDSSHATSVRPSGTGDRRGRGGRQWRGKRALIYRPGASERQ